MIIAGKPIKKILKLFMAEYPDAQTMLVFNSRFELLVAVILSAQSTDVQVNRVTAELFKKYKNPEDMAAISLSELEHLIKGVGLYKSKAKNIKAMAEILINQHNGQVPAEFDQLMQLPGVGRKTANVILAVGFNQPGLGVDTHVHRVANRLGLVDTKNAHKTEKELKELIPQELWSQSHHLFIWHGRRVCKARNPMCEQCVVKELCMSR